MSDIIMDLSKTNASIADSEILYEISKGKKIIIQLGTALGFGAMVLASHGGKVYTIDNYKILESKFGSILLNKTESNSISNVISQYLDLFGGISLIYGDTAESSIKFEDNSVDLLYIDADHTYNGVKRDYYSWINKVKYGGIILFHDYSSYFPDIPKFIDIEIKQEEEKGILKKILFNNSVTESVIKGFSKL